MFRKMSSTAVTTIAQRLQQVTEKISAAGLRRPQTLQYVQPRLVAVSKTKSVDMVIEAYDAGQRHFGENYVVELHEKSNDIELQDRCEDIRWHFIGHLQGNKIKKVLDTPGLYAIETIDREKLAKQVNDTWDKLQRPGCLHVMVQVNSSGESNKNGVALGETVGLVRYIRDNCPRLKLMGLMTIGAYNYDTALGPNPDFLALVKEREAVCEAVGIPAEELELSMGMSSDFEQAIEMGSTEVRVGSTIFGTRAPLKKGTFAESSTSEGNNPTSSSDKVSSSSDNSSPQVNVTQASDLPTEHMQQLALS